MSVSHFVEMLLVYLWVTKGSVVRGRTNPDHPELEPAETGGTELQSLSVWVRYSESSEWYEGDRWELARRLGMRLVPGPEGDRLTARQWSNESQTITSPFRPSS